MDWERLIRDELAPMVPYAPGLRASEVREQCGCDVIHKLSSNENPYGPVPLAVDAMTALLPRLNVYPDGSARALRGALASHLAVDASNVAVGNGSNELIRLIAQAVLRPGDECVFAWPSFVVYPMVTQLMGATAVRVGLTDGQVHDLDAMLDAITDRTRLVFLCNPNNPTGTIYTRDDFAKFMDQVPDDVLVVVDEAYFEYATAERVSQRPRLVRRDSTAVRSSYVQQDLLAGGTTCRLRGSPGADGLGREQDSRAVQREFRISGCGVLLASGRARDCSSTGRERRAARSAHARLRSVGREVVSLRDQLRLHPDRHAR